jgi:hypothetical protein
MYDQIIFIQYRKIIFLYFCIQIALPDPAVLAGPREQFFSMKYEDWYNFHKDSMDWWKGKRLETMEFPITYEIIFPPIH